MFHTMHVNSCCLLAPPSRPQNPQASATHSWICPHADGKVVAVATARFSLDGGRPGNGGRAKGFCLFFSIPPCALRLATDVRAPAEGPKKGNPDATLSPTVTLLTFKARTEIKRETRGRLPPQVFKCSLLASSGSSAGSYLFALNAIKYDTEEEEGPARYSEPMPGNQATSNTARNPARPTGGQWGARGSAGANQY